MVSSDWNLQIKAQVRYKVVNFTGSSLLCSIISVGSNLKTGTDTKMAVSRKLVDRLGDTVRDCHLAFKQERSGKPADYIPALAEVDPELFAVSVCTVDGECFSAGDCEQLFSIQSVSKPFLYAQAPLAAGREPGNGEGRGGADRI